MYNHKDVKAYNESVQTERIDICNQLAEIIDSSMHGAENKVWHGAPVWFLEGNPIVGYSSLKSGVRLMFWSGVSFEEPGLQPGSGKFKDASITYASVDQIDLDDVRRWLKKSEVIQWDYKNIVKKKGLLERLK